MSVQPKHKQIQISPPERIIQRFYEELTILEHIIEFPKFHFYFCKCLLSLGLPSWYSWSCRALFLARYFILLDYNTIKAVPIARLARYRFHSKITSIRRIAASISTYHVPVLKPLTTFYIALQRRRRKGKMKDYWLLLFLFILYTDWNSLWGHFETKKCIISHFEREA